MRAKILFTQNRRGRLLVTMTQAQLPVRQHPEGLELVSARGEARGHVDPKQVNGRYVLEELWIMQGSLCDLKCTHCYVASSPTNNRLEQIAFEELRAHLDDAVRFGVQKIYFTGGEVFFNEAVLRRQASSNEEFVHSLSYALGIAPVEILTNGRRYIRNHFAVLGELRAHHGDRLRLRVTLESLRAEQHDAIRGKSTFAQTVETINQLQEMGFVPVLTASGLSSLKGATKKSGPLAGRSSACPSR